ncbi:MAG TPA: hypothetical protein VGP24_09860 [Glaciihabitans sp.]|jgi:hypothetical protein|nr:hypothetical protein [Glaciihabitans sp.]
MMTPLATDVGLPEHPPQPSQIPSPTADEHKPPMVTVRRVGLLDRAALHLGVALIKWGRRPGKAAWRHTAKFNPELEQARLDMERARDRFLAMNLSRLL